MSMVIKGFALVFVLIYCISCGKEKDVIKPVIVLYTPFEEEVFKVFDEILVTGTVEDDIKVDFLRISLVNEAQIPVAPAILIKGDEKKITFSNGIQLNNIHLGSGTYYLVATASDGYNESKLFRKIYIHEAPEKRKGVFVITSDGLSTKADLIDSTGQQGLYTFFKGDYSGSALSSYYQSLTVAGYKTGDVASVNLKDKTVKWEKPSHRQSTPTFTSLDYLDKLNYVSYYNEVIEGYTDNGSARVAFTAFQGFCSKKMTDMDTHLISYQEAITGNQKILVTYFKATGAYFHQIPIDFEVADFCGKSGKDILVFGNKGDAGLIKVYESDKNNFWEPFKIQGGKIKSAVKIDENTYMFSNEDGLYKYHFTPNTTFLYKSGAFSKLAYDKLNEQLIVAEGNKVNFYNYTTGELISTYSFSGEIKNILIWYNK